MNTKRQRGITLIALVITIIVLLILAGISIATLIGENGLLTKAIETRKNTEMAEIKERAELVKNEMIIEEKNNKDNIKRGALVSEINAELDGVKEGYSSIVRQGKYIVKVDSELNITVEEYTGEFLENGELGLILTCLTTEKNVEAVKIEVEVRIGGMPSYEEYAQEILEEKTIEEKEQYFIEYYRNNMENQYPEYEVNVDNILKYYLRKENMTLEDYYKERGYETLDKYLISNRMVEKSLYSNSIITVTLPNGNKSNLNLLYPTTTFTVYNNGKYTINAEYETQKIEKTIDISNIIDKVVYELPKEDENTYTISCIEDLVGLSLNVNNCVNNYSGKTVKLLNNLDFNDDDSYKNPNDKSLGDINNDGKVEEIKTEVTTGSGFVPIGIGSDYDSVSNVSLYKYFNGKFDGNGKEIANLYINSIETPEKTEEYIGLFGYISSSAFEVKNLTLTGNITVDKTLQPGAVEYVGGIVGYLSSGSIEGCNNYTNIKTSTDWTNLTGGITGYIPYFGSVKNCNNYGNISGHQSGAVLELGTVNPYYCYYGGGIVGYNAYDGKVIASQNYGDIDITYDNTYYDIYIGGIVGYNCKNLYTTVTSISECHNYATLGIEGERTYK